MTERPKDATPPSGEKIPSTEILCAVGRAEALVRQFGLRAIAGPDQGTAWKSSGDRVLVGSDRTADVILSDRTVSRFHCEIVLSDGRPVVRDLDSRNGTVVDGTGVLAAHLKSGAVLALGKSQLRFELGEERVSIPLSEHDRFGRMVGSSGAMRAVFAVLERAAQSSSTVLLMGETGTGKDVAAEMLHGSGPRANGPFAVVDCGAVPPHLLESELFGHEMGAFAGADRVRVGAFELASGGTLFLDEIGELAADLQPKLLRALESRQIQRVGGTGRIPVDVRVIASTNRNLWAEVNAHRFRSDLYYRLAVIKVTLPPLRERPSDVPQLVDELLTSLGAAGTSAAAATLRAPELLAELGRHAWPGNVRELRNYLERCVALEAALPIEEIADGSGPPIDLSQSLAAARERWVRAFEKQYGAALLSAHGHNVAAAARAAGVDRTTFYRLLVRCGIDLGGKKS